MTKRTFVGRKKRKRVSGFRVRMRSHTGEELLRAEDKKVEKE